MYISYFWCKTSNSERFKSCSHCTVRLHYCNIVGVSMYMSCVVCFVSVIPCTLINIACCYILHCGRWSNVVSSYYFRFLWGKQRLVYVRMYMMCPLTNVCKSKIDEKNKSLCVRACVVKNELKPSSVVSHMLFRLLLLSLRADHVSAGGQKLSEQSMLSCPCLAQHSVANQDLLEKTRICTSNNGWK